ncbi:glutamine-synthetase adenylyltransferase [Methylacidiphilum caldifontis]|uniref:[protein-PII] uridylyltransferase family protein n=1 Tax=Methylacidiphilum caldifontis TaxID=2795386 RepID=UPI001A8F59F6|nr:glutamine-synthetase adenylyltransferase [Methylacidiphilum caldifontis]QSR88950.1 glutamine-synthetase adenylyltransferase [Methylacidiphilum caldifontis]
MERFGRFSTLEEALEDFQQFSEFARTQFKAHPDWLEWIKSRDISDPSYLRGPGKLKIDWLERASHCSSSLQSRIEALKQLKQREILRIGFFDFSSVWNLEKVLKNLSLLADFCLEVLLELAKEDQLSLSSFPFTIISMGKLGGNELNYSSDIDLVFIHNGSEAHHDKANRLGKKIIQLFSLAQGGFYRIDLRLRPEGNSGVLVPSLKYCENYYFSLGESWERMALIKARRSAGDHSLAYEFEILRSLFSFPKHLTEEMFEEVIEIKSRIEKEILAEGSRKRNIKLGEGGIREIEFIVQSFQVVYGARFPTLQGRSTQETLDGLCDCGLIPRKEAEELKVAYTFLRRVENRLQMVADLQTHLLPDNVDKKKAIALSLGLELELFESQVEYHMSNVRRLFSSLFPLSNKKKEFSFNFGIFPDPRKARRDLQSLEEGHSFRTTKSLRRFFPILEEKLSHSVDPNLCLSRFVQFADRYGLKSMLYESLASSPKALELLLGLFDRSSFFTEILLYQPELFEEVCQSDGLYTKKTVDVFYNELDLIDKDYKTRYRIYRKGELFRIFLRDILGLASLLEIEEEYTALAEAILKQVTKHCHAQSNAIIGMGRLGGKELGYGSDLDCLLIGDNLGGALELNRFLSEMLPTGILYNFDFRLRPHGEGPIVLERQRYEEYYRTQAQFWEVQALHRARFVCGNEEEGMKFIRFVDSLWIHWSRQIPWQEFFALREKIQRERDNHVPLINRFKTAPGGLMDIELGSQIWLMLRQIREPSLWKAFLWIEEEDPQTAQKIRSGYLFLRQLESVLRRERNSPVSVIPTEESAKEKLARFLGFNSTKQFMENYVQVLESNREVFETLTSQKLP